MNAILAKQICATILTQLGGNKFLLMTGSKVKYYKIEDGLLSLVFSLTRNKNKYQFLTISLNVLDLYDMTFSKVNPPTKKEIDKWFNGEAPDYPEAKVTKELIENVYVEDLQTIFTEKTGLFTCL